MKYFHTVLIVFTASAFALDSGLPTATQASQNTFPLDGWTPKPTDPGLDLLRRQGSQVGDPNTICGYADGDPTLPIDCSGNLCGFNTKYGWFGCCASSTAGVSGYEPAGCPIVTDCVPYHQLTACDTACAANTMITKCTDSVSAFCAVGTIIEVTGLSEWICATSAFTLGIALSATGGGDISQTPVTTSPKATPTVPNVPSSHSGGNGIGSSQGPASTPSSTPTPFVLPGSSTGSTPGPSHVPNSGSTIISSEMLRVTLGFIVGSCALIY